MSRNPDQGEAYKYYQATIRYTENLRMILRDLRKSIEYGKNHFDLITLVQQGIISFVQLDLPTFRQKLNRIYCSSIRSTLNIA